MRPDVFLSHFDHLAGPSLQVEAAADLRDTEDEWFFQSPEFAYWQWGNSQFLWLSDPPDSGCTNPSIRLWNSMLRNDSFHRNKEVATYFCLPLNHVNLTPEWQTAQILSSFILQLLKGDKERT